MITAKEVREICYSPVRDACELVLEPLIREAAKLHKTEIRVSDKETLELLYRNGDATHFFKYLQSKGFTVRWILKSFSRGELTKVL